MAKAAMYSKNQLSKALMQFSTYTILVWPIRLLIIVSAILIPVLLGLIIWFYYRHQNQIDDVLKQARTIEGMIVNNVEKGIDFIKSEIGVINEENINNFIEKQLWPHLQELIVNYYNQANDKVKTIKIDVSDLNHIKITFDGRTTQINNMETLIKTEIKYLMDDVIPQIVDGLKDVIKDKIRDNPEEFNNKMKELEELLKAFSGDSDNTIGYLMTQLSLFFKT